MNRALPSLLLAFLALAAFSAEADSITIGGTRYEGVYVVEGPNAIYVSLPDEGRTISALKNDPSVTDLKISRNEDERDDLYRQFKSKRDEVRAESSPDERGFGTVTSIESRLTADDISESGVARDTRSSVPLLVLRGQPAPADPQMQAVIASNLSRAGRSAAPRATGPGRAPGGAPSMGGGNIGTGGTGAALGGGGRGGGNTGGRAGGGGAQGGAGGQSAGGAGFSNISELFDTIDDAEVGETPNPITGNR